MVTKKFKKEFRKQIRLAIAAAIGFIIAFAWREFIVGLVIKQMGKLSILMPHTTRFLSALFITIVGVLLILLSSRLLE